MKKFWLALLIILVAVGGLRFYQKRQAQKNVVTYSEARPEYGVVREIISATGTVEPQNRLEIIPPISGRIDKIFVQEGTLVQAGEQLALMSSTDRAALLDTASTQGAEKVQYWSDVYKPTPILAPIAGRVIVRSIEPGQTVNTSTKILVLADTLIVKAQIDETDIGKVEVGQKTAITLDAYPDVQIAGRINRISYESTVVNNVTIYTVEITPDKIPAIFRSGMSANIEIIRRQKDRALLIPERALTYSGGSASVFIQTPAGRQKTPVQTGLAQNGQIEIISGLTENDIVLIAERQGATGGAASGSPFMPNRNNARGGARTAR
ncbi:MAG: HlyD family efflux transporter periplasmic adaptor subunit [Candidatus Margulisbacteria bacterium]|jgi:macrolide-specific efflux system membrane fusion protein|nr:HlyD family efflux transporter periplasmic adaptor subunit [Candidatus Margulisiibacteriota bacterium]